MPSPYAFGKPQRGNVTLTLAELNALIDRADKALDGDSNDAEHDALYTLRETLAKYSTDPERRVEGRP